MTYVGLDIIEVDRVSRVVTRWKERFLHRIYTPAELEFCRNRIPALAVRFAAKEAVMKVLGTGTHGVGWREIEVLSEPGGRPFISLHGRARQKAGDLGLVQISVSLSHSRDYALASAVGVGR